MAEFTNAQIKYLKSQRLGRLATLRSDGTLQNNPVGFAFDETTGTFELGGFNMERRNERTGGSSLRMNDVTADRGESGGCSRTEVVKPQGTSNALLLRHQPSRAQLPDELRSDRSSTAEDQQTGRCSRR